jgi:peroxiredoxin
MKTTPFLVAMLCFAQTLFAQQWQIGDSLKTENTNNNQLIVHIPSLAPECQYASMLVRAFKNYFQDNEAIRTQLQIVLIVSDTAFNSIRTHQNDQTGLFDKKFLQSHNKKLIAQYKLQPFDSLNSSAKVYLIKNNIMVYKDENYRAFGSNLKPLEIVIEKAFGLYKPIRQIKTKNLKVGDAAPKIKNEDGTPYNYSSANKTIVSFYPAAFTGNIPLNSTDSAFYYPPAIKKIRLEQANIGILHSIELPQNGSFDTTGIVRIDFNRVIMSCIAQPRFLVSLTADDLKKIKFTAKTPTDLSAPKGIVDTKIFTVTNAKKDILEKWKTYQNTPTIMYLNDEDFSLAQQFNSLNEEGYCKRTAFIIDKKGIIRFADTDFEYDDEAKMKQVLEQIKNEK